MKYDFEQAVSMARASWRRIAPVPVPPYKDPSIGDAGFQILPGDVSLAIQVAWVEVEDGKEKPNVHWQYISSGCPSTPLRQVDWILSSAYLQVPKVVKSICLTVHKQLRSFSGCNLQRFSSLHV